MNITLIIKKKNHIMDSLSYSYGIIHAEMLKKNKHFRLDPYESGLSKVCDNKERNVSYDNIFTDVWKGKQYHQKQRQLLYDDSQMTNILYNYKDSFFIGVYIGNQFRKQEIKINKYDYIKAIKDILASRPTNLTFQQAINVINEFNKSRNEPCPGKVKKEAVKKQDKSSDERICIQSLPEYKQKRYVIYRFLVEDGYDVGDFEAFSEKLNNPEKQKSVYNELFRLGFEVGSFSSFAQKICTPHTKESNGTAYGIGQVTPSTIKNVYFLDLESEEPRQELSDWSTKYNMSHGHMCPAADNKWDKAAMNQSFLLTNMCPQDVKLNGGAWQKLEEKCRVWANKYGAISIVAGPIFINPPSRFLGQIAVPDAFFKVVLCLNGKPKAIGFVYENSSKNQTMYDTYCSVDHIEEITGFDFFGNVDDSIEAVIESECNINEW